MTSRQVAPSRDLSGQLLLCSRVSNAQLVAKENLEKDEEPPGYMLVVGVFWKRMWSVLHD